MKETTKYGEKRAICKYLLNAVVAVVTFAGELSARKPKVIPLLPLIGATVDVGLLKHFTLEFSFSTNLIT